MARRRAGGWVVPTLVLVGFCAGARAADLYVMPYDVDPPITIDGNLDDWENVPNAIELRRKEQVTYMPQTWTGPEDLSGTIRLAWRQGIYIAAEVTDQRVLQPYGGARTYQGDHINLWIDLRPTFEPTRTTFGAGQYHIAVSPGNFGGQAGGSKPLKPEVIIYVPESFAAKDSRAAARRTRTGYVIEAFIAFSDLRVGRVEQGQYATFEVAIGDTDVTPVRQETFITSGTRQWQYLRTRMRPMVFGSGAGKGSLPSTTVAVAKSLEIPKGRKKSVTFQVTSLPVGQEPFVFFKARMDNEVVAGYAGRSLLVEINGQRIGGTRLTNRPMTATMEDNREQIIATRDGRITVPSAPDFTSTDKNDRGYALRGGVKAAEYEFYVGGLLKTGKNTLVFSNISGHPTHTFIQIGDVELRTRPFAPGSRRLRDAPTGELPVREPQATFPKTYGELQQDGGEISFVVGSERYRVESRFSTPDGGWQAGSNKFFVHRRRLIEHDEWIEVRDTFRNLTEENLPLMQKHDIVFDAPADGVWLSGIKKPFKTGRYERFENPSVLATTSAGGVGLLPLNDEFRVHAEQSAAEGKYVRLADRTFVLRPGTEYTAELAIVPVHRPDYWTFINAARRVLDVNFPLKYMFTFAQLRYPVYDWSDAKLREYVVNKSANFVVQGLQVELYQGTAPHGLAFLQIPHDGYALFSKRIRKLFPDGRVKSGIYFHCFLDIMEENRTRFARDRGLDVNGNHIGYSGPDDVNKIYIPTLDNDWGKAVGKVIDAILDEIGADGVYWDEFSFSKVHYVYNMWDGCSADIGPDHRIRRLKGNVPLLSRDFRLKQVKRILDRGAPFIINGQPATRTLQRLKFQAFVETGSGPANCFRTHLYSPVILGDHLTERNYLDIYRNMVMGLDHGCLYAYYYNRFMKYKTLSEYMYPFTPIELHAGYVVGKERILTSRSGLFGWGDASDFDVHVFDRKGKQTDGGEAKKVRRGGKTYVELRIPEGYSAAIVRVVR